LKDILNELLYFQIGFLDTHPQFSLAGIEPREKHWEIAMKEKGILYSQTRFEPSEIFPGSCFNFEDFGEVLMAIVVSEEIKHHTLGNAPQKRSKPIKRRYLRLFGRSEGCPSKVEYIPVED